MYFVTDTTQSVTHADHMLLGHVCATLRALCDVGARHTEANPHWSMLDIDCHTIARLISRIFPELTLVDGYIIGLDIKSSNDTIPTVNTDHSWLQTPDQAIIDPYPMGLISTTGALLIPTSGTKFVAHGSNLYQEDKSVRSRFNAEEKWREARSCMRLLRKYVSHKDLVKIYADIY